MAIVTKGCCGAKGTFDVPVNATVQEIARLTGMSLEKAIAIAASFVTATCSDGYVCQTCEGCTFDCDAVSISFDNDILTLV
jgi:hypothetical protein